MRVIVAPDCFSGTLTAFEAASAIALGWRTVAPEDHLDLCPMSDGGPGFLDALHCALGGVVRPVAASGPQGEPVSAWILRLGDTAYIESAQVCGLDLIPPARRAPGRTTSRGLADLLRAAIDDGASRIVVGLGGTGTCDAGAGMLAGLGATARDLDGQDMTAALLRGGEALGEVATIDLDEARALMAQVILIAATDVDVPLLGSRGAALGFAPQKGASEEVAQTLEKRLAGFAAAVGRRPDGRSPAVALGAGAGGGLGFALLALGGRRTAGVESVMEAVHLRQRCADADLIITGEGSCDWQSLRGKVLTGVTGAAMESGCPVLVIAGRVDVGRRDWQAAGVAGVYSLEAIAGPDAVTRAREVLMEAAGQAARSWSR